MFPRCCTIFDRLRRSVRFVLARPAPIIVARSARRDGAIARVAIHRQKMDEKCAIKFLRYLSDSVSRVKSIREVQLSLPARTPYEYSNSISPIMRPDIRNFRTHFSSISCPVKAVSFKLRRPRKSTSYIPLVFVNLHAKLRRRDREPPRNFTSRRSYRPASDTVFQGISRAD